ncbi:MAG: helix-turn-helix domain-containing protein [Pseudomonadota bacterium]
MSDLRPQVTADPLHLTFDVAVQKAMTAALADGLSPIAIANTLMEAHEIARRRSLSDATAADVFDAIYEVTGISKTLLRKPNRKRSIAWTRQCAMSLMADLPRMSLPAVGRLFDRDHTTVMHARQVVRERLAFDEPSTLLVMSQAPIVMDRLVSERRIGRANG